MFFVDTIELEGLGNRSYLAGGECTAVAVDPPRDVDQVLAAAARRGVRIAYVVETHIHNDYVTGGLELARITGAQYLVPADANVSFARVAVADGDTVDDRRRQPGDADRDRDPGPHPAPHLLRAAGGGAAGGRLHRRIAADRHGGPTGPGRAAADRAAGPRPACLRPPTGRPSCRTRRRCCPRTASAASAPRPSPRGTRPPSARRRPPTGRSPSTWTPSSPTCWPGWRTFPPTTRTWVRPTPPAPHRST